METGRTRSHPELVSKLQGYEFIAVRYNIAVINDLQVPSTTPNYTNVINNYVPIKKGELSTLCGVRRREYISVDGITTIIRMFTCKCMSASLSSFL